MVFYKLNYFETRGLGEAVRFLLSYGEVEFEDNRIAKSHWHQFKQTIPFGKVPTLEIDGQVAYQSVAICRYLARQFALAGSDDWEALEIDAVVDTITDLRTQMVNIYAAHDLASKEKLRETLINESLPSYLEKLDNLIRDNGGYFVGGKLSWADLYFISGYESYGIISQRDVLKDYPNIQILRKTVVTLPPIKAWIAKRPESMF